MKYNSVPQTAPQLAKNLLSKGLLTEDILLVERDLLMIGYFRFKRYSTQFHVPDGKGDFSFIKDTYFEDVKDAYVFDSALRVIIFEAVAEIEIAFKSILNYTMTLKHGTHWYLDAGVFTSTFLTTLDPNYLSNYDRFITSLTKDCAESNEPFIKRYRQNFSEPPLPPSWFVMEIISFGTCCILYQNIASSAERTIISDHFNTNQKVFETWLRNMSYLRNQCAHHHKMINRTFMFPPIIPQREKNRFLADYDKIESDKLYAALCIIQYCIISLKSNCFFKENLIALIDNNPHINILNLGFMKDWRNENIWK